MKLCRCDDDRLGLVEVILTGTPQGVGPLRPGDTMPARIDAIGSMRVEVSAA